MKAVLAVAVALLLAGACVSGPPLGLDLHVPAPLGNQLTREKISLGRRLFFDTRLSRDGTLSCASCHEPALAFSDRRARSRGVGGAEGRRNAPALINRGYGEVFFWDGRAATLEQLAVEPILDVHELANTAAEVERRTGLRMDDIATALASYLRTIRSGDSRFDRYTVGDTRALNALEKDGLAIFRGKGGCTACHIGPNFSDERFHNTGIAWRGGRLADEGRAAVTRRERDRGAFKTPTLRDLRRTAPYMHDGSLPTLDAVIDFYSDGGRSNPYLDPEIRPRRLTPGEKRALKAFLLTLSGRVREG